MRKRINALVEIITILGIMLLFGKAYAGGMPTFDATTNTSVLKQTIETKKIVENSEGTLEKTTGILDQAEDLNKAIGDPTQVKVKAFDWLNSTSSAANNALKSCGIAGFIPPLSTFEIPGIDLPSMDLSCLKDSLSAVKSVLFTYKKIDDDMHDGGLDVEISNTSTADYAALTGKPHYFPRGRKELKLRQRDYQSQTIKTTLAAANRAHSSGLSVLETQAKMAMLAGSPNEMIELIRILISVNLATYTAQLEANQVDAAVANMLAAERMGKARPEQIAEAD